MLPVVGRPRAFPEGARRQFDPADQEELPHPRLGFYGVIDERFDIELLDRSREMRPDWSFVMVGPVVKIARGRLPRRPNIHYLGPKTYAELPSYLAGWDVALMPFAMNEATEFISPTKTPEYLAGGKPVVSTPVQRRGAPLRPARGRADRRRRRRASSPRARRRSSWRAIPNGGWLAEADLLLSATSWDTTQARMAGLIAEVLGERRATATPALLVAAE